jgi:hypothetical protein
VTQTGKRKVKLSLFIVYIGNPKESTKVIPKLLRESNKVAEYKINV